MPDALERAPDWAKMPLPEVTESPRAHLYDGYDPYVGLGQEEFYARYFNPDAGKEGEWRFPGDEGFSPGTRVLNALQPGDVIDRFGPTSGRYASPPETPFAERALPPSSVEYAYDQYKVAKPPPEDVVGGSDRACLRATCWRQGDGPKASTGNDPVLAPRVSHAALAIGHGHGWRAGGHGPRRLAPHHPRGRRPRAPQVESASPCHCSTQSCSSANVGDGRGGDVRQADGGSVVMTEQPPQGDPGLKHFHELPASHQHRAEPMGGYSEALHEALSGGRVVWSERVPGMDGVGESTRMMIHGEVDARTMEALVFVSSEGRAVVATFGTPELRPE